MAATGCPTLISDGVYGQVLSVMDGMWGNAQNAYNVSIQALSDLGTLRLNPIGTDVHFNPDTDLWRVLRPTGPTDPNLVWDPDTGIVPPPPNIDTGPDPAFVNAPTFTATEPVIPTRTGPGPLTATPPGAAPVLDTVTVPDAPNIVLPDFPELLTIDLPEVPIITLPTFEGVRPNLTLIAPANNFAFDVQQYASPLADAIRTKLQVMINGAPGLPDAARRQMREQLYAAIDANTARAEQEQVEQFTARGFGRPNGTLARALLEVRADGQNKLADAARTVYLKDVDIAVEDLRFAVAQGIAYETVLMSTFIETQRMMLDVAKFTIQIAIEIFNAQVALANLELQLYQADAQVFRDRIQAELAKIEFYKGQLEGQRLRGELNVQTVQIYSERVKAVFSLVELYKAMIEGAKAKADVNVARTQAYMAQTQAYAELVKAYETEWEAFGKQLDADQSKYRLYELQTKVFENRIDIWSKTNTNLIDQKRLRISDKELDLKGYDSRLEAVRTALTAEAQRIDALVRVFVSKVEKYRADAQVEQVISDGNSRIFQLAVEQERTRVETELKNSELAITQAAKLTEILVSAKQAIAQIGAQLAAGFASAMSVHAGISSSLSQSLGCETRFNYQVSQ